MIVRIATTDRSQNRFNIQDPAEICQEESKVIKSSDDDELRTPLLLATADTSIYRRWAGLKKKKKSLRKRVLKLGHHLHETLDVIDSGVPIGRADVRQGASSLWMHGSSIIRAQ